MRCSEYAFLDQTVVLKFEKARENHPNKDDRKTRSEIEELRQMILQQQKVIEGFIGNQQKIKGGSPVFES